MSRWNQGPRIMEAVPLPPPGPPSPDQCKRAAAIAWHDGTAVRMGFCAWYPNPGEDRLTCVVSMGRYYGHELFIWGSPAAEEEGQVVTKILHHDDQVFDHDILLHVGEKTVFQLAGGMPKAEEPTPMWEPVYADLDKPLGFFASLRRRWQLWRASKAIGRHLAKTEADRQLRSRGVEAPAAAPGPDPTEEAHRKRGAEMMERALLAKVRPRYSRSRWER